jgi:hypothetical protein
LPIAIAGLFLTRVTFADDLRNEEIRDYLKVMEALRDVAEATTNDRDWGLIRAKIVPIINNELDDDQLCRIGISCYAVVLDGSADEHVYDSVWEVASLECARVLASRRGGYVAHLLQEMKTLCGRDGANATEYRELIQRQKSLK